MIGQLRGDAILAGPAQRANTVAAEGSRVDALLCWLLAAYVATLACEGPLRWGLVLAGLPDVLYLRDAIPTGTLAFLFTRRLMVEGEIDGPIALFMVVLVLHAAVSALLGVQFFAILFALKILLIIPYGMAMWPLLRARVHAVAVFVWLLFAVTLAGVCVNGLMGRYPWEAIEYDTLFGAVQTTREWWDMGRSRLPGLARTSFNAAIILGLAGYLAMLTLRHWLLRLALAAVILAALIATTSKGMVVAFSLTATWLLLAGERPWHARLGRWLVYAVAALGLVLPCLVMVLDVGAGVPDSAVPDLLTSVWGRFLIMWPGAFDLLPGGPAALLGAGLGGIGTPQLYGGAPHHFNAGDNLALYLGAAFGLAGLLYFVLPAALLRRAAAEPDPRLVQACTGVMLMAYTYGVTTSVVEDVFFSIACGLAIAMASSRFDDPRKAPHARAAHR